MPFDGQIMTLFSLEAFRRVIANEALGLYEFNMLTNLLVAREIPFDVSFVSGSRKEAPAFQLTIHINPTATLVLVVALTPGSTVFAPSP